MTPTVSSASAILLIVSFALNLSGVFMWNASNTLKCFPETPTYFMWERGLLMAGFAIAALGVALLEIILSEAGVAVLARLGATAFLIGTVLALVAEAGILSEAGSTTSLMATTMVVLFVAEAILGGALLASHLSPDWVGWAVLVWNIGWLIILPVVSPRDLYYPILPFVPALLIGIALLLRK
jgi:hypothetical protein